ncbi:hypothetical protein G7077_11445 [Sphingomonas piscis]|uniref:Putative Flp pilus-assembly TadG-like N-terminal domain-containing protein n=1 Tax=Sphingomonas piscis TaxID=2714943 RepID=A0A6G7YRQ9_9SPHN|nr:Tad domain-containing protein [Sphingomonas piscis]QIK79426.1 hypothetical protein G7077_11445 [Sphingomonas piscis]
MISLLKKLWNDRSGNALVVVCATMPLVVAAAGLASDTIQWTLWKRQLQRAADSAAIAGVYDRSQNTGATTYTNAAVTRDLALNDHTWMALKTGYPQVSFPADSGVAKYQVEVSLAVQQPLPFSAFFLTTAPTITATARAASVPSEGDPCINSLDTSASTGVSFTGNAGVEMANCLIHSNSRSSNSASAGGSSSVTALAVSAVGGIQSSNNWHVQAYRPYSVTIDDPFSSVDPNPADMNCKAGQMPANPSADIASGKNCWGSISVGPGETFDLPDDRTYYINGGDMDVKGTLTCQRCTFVLTNNSSASSPTIGQLKVNSSADINIEAPTTGTFKGIAIMQDRRAGTSNQDNKVNGNSGSIIQGALYFPTQSLDYNGSGTTSAICTMFVTFRVKFSGNSSTTNKFKSMSECGAYGLGGNASLRMVRLVS